MITLHVQPNDENKRLDNFIAKCYPNLLKTLIYKWLRTKKIKVNNQKKDPNYRLQPNDEIVIYLSEDLLNKFLKFLSVEYENNTSKNSLDNRINSITRTITDKYDKYIKNRQLY